VYPARAARISSTTRQPSSWNPAVKQTRLRAAERYANAQKQDLAELLGCD
jgi:hypothetical protein